MQQQEQLESAKEADSSHELLKENESLSGRLEIYRWLFWIAVFFILVLFVAQCAKR